MNFKDHEEKIMCPYNEAHLIMRKRMEGHLVKCRKNYTGEMVMVECDFDHTHRIYAPELNCHHEICSARKNIESVVYREETVDDADPFKIVNIETPVEDWDDEPVAAYNPQETIVHKDILRHLDVESAAKKKAFRVEERKRISGIQMNPPKIIQQKAPKPKDKLTEAPVTVREEAAADLPDRIVDLMRRVRIGEDKVLIPKLPEK